MDFVSYTQFVGDIVEWARELPKDFDLIVAIPRSGLLPASILSYQLNLPLTTIDLYANHDQLLKTGLYTLPVGGRSCIEKVLVIDDIGLSGREIERAKAQLAGKTDVHISYGAVYNQSHPKKVRNLDYFYTTKQNRTIGEWNVMRNKYYLARCCMDIDGVLCRDPTREEDSNEEKYLDFITHVPLASKPSFRVKYLVTGRLERYREPTERWLADNGIVYDQLIMMPLPDKETKARLGNAPRYKADFYRASGAAIFIESNDSEARRIMRYAKRPVLCTDTMTLYQDWVTDTGRVIARRGRRLVSRVVRKSRRSIMRMLQGPGSRSRPGTARRWP